MITFEAETLTAAQIREIEARAHQMRAEAFAKALRSLFAAVSHGVHDIFACPSHARPLHG